MKLIFIFIGDIGGFIGLLLGGSLLSVMELLDLFIYNSLVKCKYKLKSMGKMQPNKTGVPSKNLQINVDHGANNATEIVKTPISTVHSESMNGMNGVDIWAKTETQYGTNYYDPYTREKNEYHDFDVKYGYAKPEVVSNGYAHH